MATISTKDGVEIFYKDWGKGQPIVFSHGWPLSADDWDTQMLFFLRHGFRVIAHDRRGHGRSTQTDGGHDMDHYADDLAALWALGRVGRFCCVPRSVTDSHAPPPPMPATVTVVQPYGKSSTLINVNFFPCAIAAFMRSTVCSVFTPRLAGSTTRASCP